ncbi:MAG: hypothetical protein NTY37_04905 [Methanothrix sp.]|nr:hypothetical protein [Methanothrix sp.]
MRWPWRRRRAIEPRPMVSRAMELETAKEILAEVFHARPGEVEEMIKSRLMERSLPEEENIWPEKREEGRWPATFCLSD